MFESIDKKSSVGIFDAPSAFNPTPKFLRFNLIYGLNGTGKSTLSRILAAPSKITVCKRLPKNAQYSINLDGKQIKSSALPLNPVRSDIYVFNKDFVEDHLNFSEANARPIVYIGKEMSDAGKKLNEISKKLKASEAQLTAEKAKLSEKDIRLKSEKRRIANRVKVDGRFQPYTALHLDKHIQAYTKDKGAHGLEKIEYSLEVLKDTTCLSKIKLPTYSNVEEFISKSLLTLFHVKNPNRIKLP